MAGPPPGLVDPVVRDALLAHEMADVLDRIMSYEGRVMHTGAGASGHGDGVASGIRVCTHGGRTFIGASGLYLGPGMIYASGDTQGTTLGTGVDIVSQPTLEVTGRTIPETLLTALAGRHVSALVEHPALADPRLIVTSARYDRAVTIKARGRPAANPPGPALTCFTVLLPQLADEMDAANPS